MRQEGTFAGSIKSKLQDLHTWKTKGVAELFHFWCNDAQIFCEDRKLFTQCFLDRFKQCFTRTFFPFTIHGGLLTGRNCPICLESTEMVNTDIIDLIQLVAYTLDPPAITIIFHGIPVIERVSPELSGSTEIIWRNSGNFQRISFGIQFKQFFVCPYICTVRCGKDRNITDDGDSFLVCIIFQLIPLAEKCKLNETIIINFGSQQLHPRRPFLRSRI